MLLFFIKSETSLYWIVSALEFSSLNSILKCYTKGAFNTQLCAFLKDVPDDKTYNTIKLNHIQNKITSRSVGNLYHNTARTNSAKMSINYFRPNIPI